MSTEEIRRAEDKMRGVIDAVKREFNAIRTSRANPALLDRVMVESYGGLYPVNQVATITAPESRMLVVQPWDRNQLPNIEKAILKANLGLTPVSDGNVLRISLPSLTEERRKELVRLAHKQAEEFKVAIRNIRREANEGLKARAKSGEISEDESKRRQEEVQKLTDKYIGEIDALLAIKESEIMEV
ncbi:MAG TPA: ribosome recycling factor [Firmicutes bacterium]|nr:ribosome recycling factor [Bacillota bacterium]HHY99158.1 ribosome recycling factor [Bacillota bacterium]